MLIVIVGKSGAGKSAFIKAMNCHDKWYRSSGLIKKEVNRRGMVVSHDTCQVVADDLYNQDAYWQIPFILDRAKEKRFLVLDGVRKIAELKRLMKFYPQTLILAIETAAPGRFKRLRQRDGISQTDFNRIEQNERETTDLPLLLETANIIISNNGKIEELEEKAAKLASLLNHE